MKTLKWLFLCSTAVLYGCAVIANSGNPRDIVTTSLSGLGSLETTESNLKNYLNEKCYNVGMPPGSGMNFFVRGELHDDLEWAAMCHERTGDLAVTLLLEEKLKEAKPYADQYLQDRRYAVAARSSKPSRLETPCVNLRGWGFEKMDGLWKDKAASVSMMRGNLNYVAAKNGIIPMTSEVVLQAYVCEELEAPELLSKINSKYRGPSLDDVGSIAGNLKRMELAAAEIEIFIPMREKITSAKRAMTGFGTEKEIKDWAVAAVVYKNATSFCEKRNYDIVICGTLKAYATNLASMY